MSTQQLIPSKSAEPASPSLMPMRNRLLQRKCACCGTPGLSSECEECRKKKLQRKLTIGASNDPLEMEADRIADQVLAAPVHSEIKTVPPHIQRYAGQTSGQMDTAPASVDPVLASSGRPLEPVLRQDMESRFGHDFSHVRVHSNAAAGQSARDVNAHAYTVGHNIVFGRNRFAPATQQGRRLIAHELTHLLQQSIGTAKATQIQRKPAPPTLEESDKSWIKAFGLGKWLKGIMSDWRDIGAQYENATAATFHPTEALLMGILTASRRRIDLGEEQIKTELNGDPALLKEFHDAYSKMISAVIPKFASLTGKDSGEVFEAHFRREIPEWAVTFPELEASLVPGLGPQGTRQVEDAIKAGKYQNAIDRLVGFKSEIKADLLADRKMIFDPFLQSDDGSTSMPRWDYLSTPQKAQPARVRIGPGAFSSVSYLYSVIMHEYQHVLWQQTLPHQEESHLLHSQGFMTPDEVEASAWELIHGTETGLARLPDRIAIIWENLNEAFWKLDAKAQASERQLAVRALQKAKDFLKGSQLTLVPFSPPSSVNP